MTDVDPNSFWVQPALDHWNMLRDELADSRMIWAGVALLSVARLTLSAVAGVATKRGVVGPSWKSVSLRARIPQLRSAPFAAPHGQHVRRARFAARPRGGLPRSRQYRPQSRRTCDRSADAPSASRYGSAERIQIGAGSGQPH
jgi:hypothetical protein